MNKHIPFFIVLFCIIFFAVCNYIWLSMDGRPLWFDFGAYFGRSINLYRSLQEGPLRFMDALLGQGLYVDAYHPHRIVLPVAPLPAYFLFGISEDVAVMSLTVFCVILALSVYGIVKESIGPEAGALAVFMTFTMPGVSWLSRHFSPEFVTTTMMALSVYLLIKSDNFRNRGYSALLGLAAAAGLLTKGIYFVFIIGPLIYAFLEVDLKKEHRMFRIGNLLIFSGICFLVIAPWYLPHLETILSRIVNVPFSERTVRLYDMPDLLSFRGLSFYLRLAINWGVSFVYFLIFIPSCFFFVKYMDSLSTGRSKRIKYILLAWIFVSYVSFTLIPSKCEEYFNPFYPVVAIVTAVAVYTLRKKFLRRLLIALIISVGCLQFYFHSFAFIEMLPKDLSADVFGQRICVMEQLPVMFPEKGDWKVKEILSYMDANKKGRTDENGAYDVCVVPDRGEMSTAVVKSYSNMLFLPVHPIGLKLDENETVPRMLRDSDFIIVKTGYQGLYLTEEDRKQVIKSIEQSGLFVKLPKDFLLPDETVLSIYKKIHEAEPAAEGSL